MCLPNGVSNPQLTSLDIMDTQHTPEEGLEPGPLENTSGICACHQRGKMQQQAPPATAGPSCPKKELQNPQGPVVLAMVPTEFPSVGR